MISAEWKGAPDFAEYAEALEVKTDQIVTALLVNDDTAAVIYTPDETDERVLLVGLGRDSDGIYRVVNAPKELPGFWDGIREGVKEQLREEEE